MLVISQLWTLKTLANCFLKVISQKYRLYYKQICEYKKQ